MDRTGLSIKRGGEEYSVQFLPREWIGNKSGYFYLLRVTGGSFLAIARFYTEDEARAFMEFLERAILGGREV